MFDINTNLNFAIARLLYNAVQNDSEPESESDNYIEFETTYQ